MTSLATNTNEFKTKLMCFSLNCSDKSEAVKNQVKFSNKIFLPPTVLQEIKEQEFPMYFTLKNSDNQLSVVCAVQEFSSAPGVMFCPWRIMEMLGIVEGHFVELSLCFPPKGDYVKFRLHESKFADLSNPKVVLEKGINKHYPVLSKGETIAIEYLEKTWLIDVVETKPADVIQILNVDLNVDFDKPLDYVEPKKVVTPEPAPVMFNQDTTSQLRRRNTSKIEQFKKNNKFVAFSGKGYTLGSS